MLQIDFCPFCGRTETLECENANEILEASKGDSNYIESPSFAVICDFRKGGCGANGGYRDSAEQAVEAWNERVKVGRVKISQPEPDNVNHPAHYTQGGIECIDAIAAAITGLEGMEAHCTGNAIKYLWRWKRKNGVEDIDKAIRYLERLKKELEATE